MKTTAILTAGALAAMLIARGGGMVSADAIIERARGR